MRPSAACCLLATMTSVFSSVLVASAPAYAQADVAAQAETLFREGKRLLEAQDFMNACAKLAESYRLEPATGALLALAVCHEGQGRTATAWVEYGEVAARSHREGRPDREAAAREKLAALEAILSTLIISPSPQAERIGWLRIQRDGLDLAPAAWGVAIPVDPGTHVVDASAPGRKPLRLSVAIGTQPERKTIIIPDLEVLPPVVQPPPEPLWMGPAAPATPAVQQPSGLITYRRSTASRVLIGLAVPALIAGATALAIGGYYGERALTKKKEYDKDPNCTYSCTALIEANTAGDHATRWVVSGSIAAAIGVVLLIVAPAAKPVQVSVETSSRSQVDSWALGIRGHF